MAVTHAPHATHPPAPLLTRRFVLLTGGDLAWFTAAGVAVYVLPLHVVGPVGSDEAGAGLAFGAFALTALVLRPWVGRLCDRVGRRGPMVGGALLGAASLLATGWADSLLGVVALRLVLGAAEALFFVAALAALADLAPPERMGEAVSWNSLGLYLGLALGPPLGEVLTASSGSKAAWTGAALLACGAAVLVRAVGETRGPGPDGPPPRRPLLHRGALAPSLGFGASVVAMSGFLAFAVLQADAVGLGSGSLPLTVYGLVVVAGRVTLRRLPDRTDPLRLAAAALATIAVGMAVVAAAPTAAGLVLGTVVLGLGVAVSTPAFFTAVMGRVAPEERGAAAGTSSMFLDLGLGGGPVVLGLVATTAGLPWLFAAGAGVAVLGCGWTYALSVRPTR